MTRRASKVIPATVVGLLLLAALAVGVVAMMSEAHAATVVSGGKVINTGGGATTIVSGGKVTTVGGSGSVTYDLAGCRQIAPFATRNTKVGAKVAAIPSSHTKVRKKGVELILYEGMYYEPVFYCGKVVYLAVEKK
jgi:hypothetical protein